MNIGIDARPLIEKKVGFGFFLENMLEAILKNDEYNTYYLFSDREIYFDVSRYKNVKCIRYKDSILFPKTFYYYFKLANYIKKLGIDLDVFWGTMHLLPRGFSKNVRKIVTMHDFTHIKFPASTTKYNLLISKLFFKSSIERADYVICISKNSEKELKEYYPQSVIGKKICTIYEGGYKEDTVAEKEIDETTLNEKVYSLKHEKYILFVGTIEPRKNISILIEAAPQLKDIVGIVICGKIGWEKKEILDKLNNTQNIFYLNYISQEEKVFLMQHALCQVQPSLYEGFGLPVVESMQSGAVVVVSNNSSLKELVEKDELKFETTNVDDFCNKIRTLCTDEALYKKMHEYCKKRGKEFSWNKAAKEYISIFEGKSDL